MDFFQLLTLVIVLAALFSYISYAFLKLPTTIGVMLLALALSLALIGLGNTAAPVERWAIDLVGKLHLNDILLHGLLAFLLFAGALHMDLTELGPRRLPIGLLAIVGTLASTAIVGFLAYALFNIPGLSIRLPLPACLLFGALISPTDPIAVIAIMKQTCAPRGLEVIMAGESLFNDAVGVVAFLTLLEATAGNHAPTFASVSLLLLREAGGGIAFGLITGYLAYRLLRRVDEYQVEILATLALAMGTYAAADVLRLSAPTAVIVAGMVIGNQGRAHAMSDTTRAHLDTFWQLVDSILNAVLFLLIGLQVLVTPFQFLYLLAGLAAIPLTLLSRLSSVSLIAASLRCWQRIPKGAISILTWGGLRGGISVAMALSLPSSDHRNIIVAMTYIVVIFSIALQGLTIGPLIKRIYPTPKEPPPTVP